MQSPDLIWKGATTECPSAGFLSTVVSRIKEEDKGSQDIFNRKKIAVAGTAVAWNGVSLDETHASSFKTKYKIYQMVREYNYVIHSTR